MRIHRQGGLWFWQAGRFGGSLYRRRFTLAQAALRHLRRKRREVALLNLALVVNTALVCAIAAQRIG